MEKNLVETSWLSNKNNVFCIDATPNNAIATRKYITGTIDIDFEKVFFAKDSDLPNTIPLSKNLDEKLTSFGISRDSNILVYDRGGTYLAFRAFFTLKGFGYKNVFVLNGGFTEWQQQNLGTTKEKTQPSHISSDFEVVKKNSFILNKEEFESLRSTCNNVVIDARSENRFLSLEDEPRSGVCRGNIPGAINIPYKTLMDEPKLKSKDALREIFSNLDVSMNSRVFVYCGSGITACIVAFACGMLGYDVYIYDGSWSEWGKI